MNGRPAPRILAILMFLLGAGCSGRDAVEKPLSEAAVEAIRAAAEAGNAEAQFQYAELLEDGFSVVQDDAAAAAWFRKAAEQGHVTAQFYLGLFLADGRGVPRDDEEAIKWYGLAAQQGDAASQFNLGAMLYREGERRDVAGALRWFRAAASQGDSDALHSLGVMYESGDGVPQDYEEAMKFYKLSAEQGNLDGFYGMASLYAGGLGIEQDIGKAVELYRRAADDPFRPHANARNDVAWIYATCADEALRDGRKAAKYALRAGAQDPKDPYFKDTLAAAYARNGWFEDAIAAAEMAIALAETGDGFDEEERAEMLADFRTRLELYRKGEAYVDTES